MVSSYKSFFNPTNMLVVAALLALILFRHSLFPEATESTEVKQLMGKVDDVVNDLKNPDADDTKTDAVVKTEEQDQSVEAVDVTEQEQAVTNTPAPVVEPEPPEFAASGASDMQKAQSIWQMARRDAWQGNIDSAIQNYRKLIALQPDNYDAYGEMGNVQMQKGDTVAAVEAYSQAALLLGKSGYPQAAWQVMDIIARLDPNRAKQLHKTLDGQPLPVVQ